MIALKGIERIEIEMETPVSLLVVDLDSGIYTKEILTPKGIVGMGGKSLGILLLERFLDPSIDPLSPTNPIILCSSPLASYAFPGSNRLAAFTKSPLTGAWLESYVGGSISRTLRETCWDAVVIKGSSPDPCRVHIDPSGATILPAEELWGLDAMETERRVVRAIGGRSAVLSIGPAGENLVTFAAVMHEEAHALGRGGLGAVFGSKHLKALSVQSSGPSKRESSAAFAASRLAISRLAMESPLSNNYRKFGTPMMVAIMNEAGAFPSDFWTKGRVPHRASLEAEGWPDWAKVETDTCNPCPMRCRKRLTLLEGPEAGTSLHGPEYETLYVFGGSCMVKDARDVARLNERCNRLGMDTISAGNILALAMKGKELGRISEGPTKGNVDELLVWLDAVAYRTPGLGAILSRGMDSAASELGIAELSITSKGLDPAGYESRKMPGMALSYALSPRGACHLRTTFYKAELSGAIKGLEARAFVDTFIDWENRLVLADSLIMCRFYRDFLTWDQLCVAASELAGQAVTKVELQETCNDVLTRIRRLNFAMGLSPADDSLPERFFSEATDFAPALDRAKFEGWIHMYWEHRLWGADGFPPAP
jgi:aldehyde:ferredoxin oxidoreductase